MTLIPSGSATRKATIQHSPRSFDHVRRETEERSEGRVGHGIAIAKYGKGHDPAMLTPLQLVCSHTGLSTKLVVHSFQNSRRRHDSEMCRCPGPRTGQVMRCEQLASISLFSHPHVLC